MTFNERRRLVEKLGDGGSGTKVFRLIQIMFCCPLSKRPSKLEGFDDSVELEIIFKEAWMTDISFFVLKRGRFFIFLYFHNPASTFYLPFL